MQRQPGVSAARQSPGKEGLQWEEWGVAVKEQLPCKDLAHHVSHREGSLGGWGVGVSSGGAYFSLW